MNEIEVPALRLLPANLSAEKASEVQQGYTPHSKESCLRALRTVLKVHTLCTAPDPPSCGSLLFCEQPGQAVSAFQAGREGAQGDAGSNPGCPAYKPRSRPVRVLPEGQIHPAVSGWTGEREGTDRVSLLSPDYF